LKDVTDSNGSNLEKLPHKLEKAQFFVIKSYSEEDIHKVHQSKDLNNLDRLLNTTCGAVQKKET